MTVTGSDILATLGAEHMEDCVAGSADADADGCDADHADADHADEPLGNAISAAHAHWHTPPQCSTRPPTHTHAHPHASQPVDGHAGTTAVKRSLRTCRLQPKVLCDADSEPEDSTPETVRKKVCRLTAHGSPRTQPCTNGF